MMIDAPMETLAPSRRLASARATSAGWIVLLVLAAMPGWPRLSWGDAQREVSRPLSRDDQEAADAIVFHGRVFDPDGQPFPGAKLYLSYYRWSERDRAQPVRATSDQEGRFRFALPRSDFDLPHFETWRNARVIALADGYPAGGSDSDEPDAGREITVRLTRDDVPVMGRVVDLEGRPVVGATVRVGMISSPAGGDLTPWLSAVAARQPDLFENESRYLKRLRTPRYDRLPGIPVVTTGADGRFTIRGIGRERVANLRFEGPTIRAMEASVMTRAGQPVQVPIFGRRKNDRVKTYHPARFELAAPPSRPIEGIVRDRDTGAPMAGVTIRSFQFADQDLGNNQLIRTQTDAAGRFRMTGMPLGKGNEVIVIPPEDQPYLPAQLKLDELTAAGPLRVEFRLKRGVWVEGKVTDKATGRPVPASIRYAAAKDNPHLAEAPGFGDLFLHGGDSPGVKETADDGTYRIAALPGRGVIEAQADNTIYPQPDRPMGGVPGLENYVPHIYGGHAIAEIDVVPGRSAPRGDFALAPGRTVAGIVLDPEGKPVTGARVNGLWPIAGWSWPQASDRFTVYGFAAPKPRNPAGLLQARSVDEMASMVLPEKPRMILVQHEARKLAGWAMVTAESRSPVEVKLQPWGSLSGRLVDSGGEPRAHFAMQPQVIDRLRLGSGTVGHWPYRIKTDRDGRFRLVGIVPGLPYRLSLENAAGHLTERGPEVSPLKPGEDRDLGDVIAVVPGESD
jgi:hypothetical protein